MDPGFLTVVGWQFVTASGAFLCGTLIQGLVALTNPTYTPERWHGTLLLWAVIFVAVIVNTVLSNLLPKLECLILIIHVLGFFAVLIPLVYMAPHGDAASVFTVFLNQGGWPTTGLSFMVGLTGNVFAFLGTLPLLLALLEPLFSNFDITGTDAAIHVRVHPISQPPQRWSHPDNSTDVGRNLKCRSQRASLHADQRHA